MRSMTNDQFVERPDTPISNHRPTFRTIEIGKATMRNSNAQLVTAYGEMVADRVDAGWEPYILTYMFKHIGGSPRHVGETMRKEVERVYATMLTRIVRHPRSEWHRWKLPMLIGGPDWPVPKHQRQDKRNVIANDGQHMHAVELMPAVSRLKERLDDHIDDEQPRYVREPLFRIHAQRITDDPGYVTEYVLKALQRGRSTPDDLIVLPRSASELPRDGISPWTRRRLAEAKLP